MQIVPSSGLSDDEVEQMVRDAEAHGEEDRRKKELAEARNAADNTAYSAEKFLREFGEQIPGDARKNVEDKIQAVREVLSSDDVARIRQRTTELGEAMQAVGAQMYEGAGPGTPPPSSEEEGPEEDVIEGEFSE